MDQHDCSQLAPHARSCRSDTRPRGKELGLKILCLPITTAPAHQNGQKPRLALSAGGSPALSEHLDAVAATPGCTASGHAAEPAERERCLGLSLQLVTCNQTTHLCSWHVCQRSFSVFWDLCTLQTDGFLARVLPPWSMRTLDTAV